jgi:hypothetical protein
MRFEELLDLARIHLMSALVDEESFLPTDEGSNREIWRHLAAVVNYDHLEPFPHLIKPRDRREGTRESGAALILRTTIKNPLTFYQ